MERQTALVLSIILFVVFIVICYYGIMMTLWSSIILSIFLSLLILCSLYPPSNVAHDDADFTLVLYATIIIIGIVLLGIYILQRTICDTRTDCTEYIECDLTQMIT